MAPYRNVHCFALALSSHGGTSEIRLPLIPGKILEPSLASLELAPGLPYESRTTQVAMLDDFLPRLTDVAFIKVDIEGHERAFLEGARRVIRTFKPLIQLEANDPTTQLASFQELAVELGYGIRSLGPGLSFVKVTQARALSENNFYFVPES
jgi:FkbM family methyltransferase